MAKKKKTVKVQTEAHDTTGPTKERLDRYDAKASGLKPSLFKTDTNRIVERLSVIDALYDADEIGPEGFLAAGMFAADYFVGIHVRTTSAFADKVDGSGSGDNFHAKRMDAAKRFNAAKISIGSSAYEVMMAVFVDGEMSLREYAMKRLGASSPSNASAKAKALLVKAINKLAKFYAPSTKAPSPRSRGYMAEGARPAIHPFQEDAA